MLDELAVGTGFGIRYDFEFFVIRLDLAFPLRLPYKIDAEGNDVNFSPKPWDRDWLREYLVWNLAIGYPF